MKRLARDEKGQALVIALILLAIGGLITAPLLSYTGTGLMAGAVYERKTDELYAADAGAEDAVWKLQHREVALCPGDPTHSYNITDVNGKSVDVTISSFYSVGNITMIYRVLSSATGDSSGTEIEAYIVGVNKYGDYAGLLGQIATSQDETDIAKKVTLVYPEGCGPYPNYPGAWPSPTELAEFFWEDVEYDEYTSDTLDINGINTELGPLYRDGELEIKNSSNTPATLTLTGTMYITGQTLIGTTGKDFTLDLDGNTIFVSDNTTGSQKALIIGTKCSIQGPGVIVAVGDINFQPKAQVTTDPVFVLSVLGTTTMQPSGNFYGALAGCVEVEIQQGTTPVLTYPEGGFDNYDLNFLTGIQRLTFHIASWEVGASAGGA